MVEIDKCKVLIKYVIPAIQYSSTVNFQKMYALVKQDAPETPRTPQSEGGFSKGSDSDKPNEPSEKADPQSPSSDLKGNSEETGF